MLLKDIDSSLMVVWSVINYKTFKIGIEGTVIAKTTLNQRTLFKELIKELRKVYSLGKDLTWMNIEGKEYGENQYVYQYRRNLWLGRSKSGRNPKARKVKDFKLLVEVNDVESVFGAKLCSIWNHKAVEKYISALTG
jgi:hypothetical protein